MKDFTKEVQIMRESEVKNIIAVRIRINGIFNMYTGVML